MKRTLVSLIIAGALAAAAAGWQAAVHAAPSTPWLNVELKDVVSGKTFKLADFKGKVVLIEMMAVWCPKCAAQQREMQKLSAELGDAVAMVSIDIDANENAEILRRHVETSNFKWVFVVAPRALTQQLVDAFGERIIDPPSTPMIILDKAQRPKVLRFGVKPSAEIRQEISKYR
ncbi:MAG: TlpA disulfide reductase family protein [bacterium]